MHCRALVLFLGCTAFVASCAGDDQKKLEPSAGNERGLAEGAERSEVFNSLPPPSQGWFDPMTVIVASDGSRSLGEPALANTTRDQGSKIVYFDAEIGANETADVYWWDGEKIIDSNGKAENPDNGEAYGTNPLEPNENAIRPFREAIGMTGNADGDPRLRTNADGFEAVAGGYPDWFLLRRGQTHTRFDNLLVGGRSATEPMVIAGYGPTRDGRARVAPEFERVAYNGAERGTVNPFSGHNFGADTSWMHTMMLSLEFTLDWSHLGADSAQSPSGGPVTAYAEDCKWEGGLAGLVYVPRATMVRRSVITGRFDSEEHNQGYYVASPSAETTFEEVIFYKNGYKSNPRREPDPRRDVFSRNIYQGGGAQLGHTYLGIISADGASGGPQMRFGGTIEQSLILEGYWFSSTDTNGENAPWMFSENQRGRSALVRNNVQLVYAFPTPADPDSVGDSDPNAQPGSGYTLQGASYGALVEGNIVSGAMLADDLQGETGGIVGLKVNPVPATDEAGKVVHQKGNEVRNNVVYRVGTGLSFEGDWTEVDGLTMSGNVFVAPQAMNAPPDALREAAQLLLSDNHFYADEGLPNLASILGDGNSRREVGNAANAESWPDPDRTLRRYVTEELGLTLLEWNDDPFLDEGLRAERASSGELYDPAGIKTFMAIATNMRKGGRNAPPSSGKPQLNGDYEWDDRFTGPAVVNWIREGFGLPEAK